MTDPFLYFYETFLGRYNLALKKSRGVYYTPQPVVRFIVRAVDEVLRHDFGLPEGLADTARTTVAVQVPEIKNGRPTGKTTTAKREVARVQVLDPATGTFLAPLRKGNASKAFFGGASRELCQPTCLTQH